MTHDRLLKLGKQIHEEKLKVKGADYNKIRKWQQEYDEEFKKIEDGHKD